MDYLESLDDLLSWGRQVGLLASEEQPLSDVHSRSTPMAMEETVARARALREMIHRVVSAVVEGAAPDGDDLSALNRAVSQTLSRLRLVHMGGTRFAWEWEAGTEAERVLWGVARSAANLLVSSDLDRVQICDGPGCGWMFVDGSRNRSRRWCDSRDCGNRERVRQHLARKRTTHPVG
jgi:predicted RNA-binding Zn ribbon-like protein